LSACGTTHRNFIQHTVTTVIVVLAVAYVTCNIVIDVFHKNASYVNLHYLLPNYAKTEKPLKIT
jgi:hypothetical protein